MRVTYEVAEAQVGPINNISFSLLYCFCFPLFDLQILQYVIGFGNSGVPYPLVMFYAMYNNIVKVYSVYYAGGFHRRDYK
jgi:hypothetical protein